MTLSMSRGYIVRSLQVELREVCWSLCNRSEAWTSQDPPQRIISPFTMFGSMRRDG